jgi:hypothetical protein
LWNFLTGTAAVMALTRASGKMRTAEPRIATISVLLMPRQ